VRLSLDQDPRFDFHRWPAHWRLLQVAAMQTVPFVPVSHPCVERLIGILRRAYWDWVYFWNQREWERKLEQFKNYYHGHRGPQGVAGKTPNEVANAQAPPRATTFQKYTWQSHGNGLFELPIAAGVPLRQAQHGQFPKKCVHHIPRRIFGRCEWGQILRQRMCRSPALPIAEQI